jgi:hypothetical protein
MWSLNDNMIEKLHREIELASRINQKVETMHQKRVAKSS